MNSNHAGLLGLIDVEAYVDTKEDFGFGTQSALTQEVTCMVAVGVMQLTKRLVDTGHG